MGYSTWPQFKIESEMHASLLGLGAPFCSLPKKICVTFFRKDKDKSKYQISSVVTKAFLKIAFSLVTYIGTKAYRNTFFKCVDSSPYSTV